MKILEYYPFPRYPDSPVEIIEGFSVYDGNLGDPPGDPHKGIDYVRRNEEGGFQSFSVHAAHGGAATCGFEESFGFFVIVRLKVGEDFFETVYAHLKSPPDFLQIKFQWPSFIFPARKISAGQKLGEVGTTGRTNGIPQLHFELLSVRFSFEIREHEKIDPYGINDRLSSGRYLQPGSPLVGLPHHHWTTDLPRFAEI